MHSGFQPGVRDPSRGHQRPGGAQGFVCSEVVKVSHVNSNLNNTLTGHLYLKTVYKIIFKIYFFCP